MANVSMDVIDSFVSESQEFLENIKKNTISFKNEVHNQDFQSTILRDLHTIKGNSRILGYYCIEKLSHSLEDVFKSIKDNKIKMSDSILRLVFYVSDRINDCIQNIISKGNDDLPIDLYIQFCDRIAVGEIINIDDMYNEIQKLKKEQLLNQQQDDDEENIVDLQSVRIKLSRINEMIASVDDMITREFRLKHQLDLLKQEEERTGSHELSKIRKQFISDIAALENSIFSMQQQVFDLRMLPIKNILSQFSNTIILESISLNKKVKADIPETEIVVDKIILEQLQDILMHLIRNALDHGIEPPEVRKSLGKSEEGTISILCQQKTNNIEIVVKDDGRGIDFQKIKQKALTLYPEREDEINNMTEKELTSFLFMSGFSTKEEVTQISGRGVGLDVVRTNIEKIKGRIKIETISGKQTSFIIDVPASLATLQGLFVYSNGEKYLIPSQFLVDIVYKKKTDYIILQNQTYIRKDNQLIPVFSLSSLFRDQKSTKQKIADSIVIAEYMEQQIGIIVDEVQQYVSLVVKPLPKAFKNFSILQGIVFDEHYDIVPILHIPDILTKFKSLRGYDIKKYEAKTKAPLYRILLVDDSDTTSQVEKGILEGNGYIVDRAIDGIDGISKLKKKQYDLVIADKDMPRMNGIVMVENIRHMENYITTPILVVSADANTETTQAFKSAGANAFLIKSDFNRGILLSTVKELLNE